MCQLFNIRFFRLFNKKSFLYFVHREMSDYAFLIIRVGTNASLKSCWQKIQRNIQINVHTFLRSIQLINFRLALPRLHFTQRSNIQGFIDRQEEDREKYSHDDESDLESKFISFTTFERSFCLERTITKSSRLPNRYRGKLTADRETRIDYKCFR